MKASVIIANYNQSHILKYVLESLRHQKTDYQFEVIVADDGSELKHVNQTIQLIQSIKDLEILYVFQQDKGHRLGKSRNNGLKLSNNEIIISIDGDIIPNDDFIQKQMIALTNKEKIITYAHRIYKNLDEIHLQESKDNSLSKLYKSEIRIKKSMKEWQRAWGYNFAFRKSDEIFWDENFDGWGMEDGEIIYRLMKFHNYKLKELTNYTVTHVNLPLIRQDNPYRTKKAKHMLAFLNNAIYFYEKYKDQEIMDTLQTIPDFEEFVKKKYTLEDGVLLKKQQTIENLYKQRKLYKDYIKQHK
jgi:glycosyltransferase involved in cell wall biosynthesis